MDKGKYKVYANIGKIIRSTKIFVFALVTELSSSIIRLHGLPEAMGRKLKKRGMYRKLEMRVKKQYPSLGLSNLFKSGHENKYSPFFGQIITMSVIVGCKFCDVHVKDMKLTLTIVKTHDGSIVPIIRHP